MQEFVNVLSLADKLLLFDVYSAGEPTITGADSQTIAKHIIQQYEKTPLLISSEKTQENFFEQLSCNLISDDILLIQGAGDIGHAAQDLEKYFLSKMDS